MHNGDTSMGLRIDNYSQKTHLKKVDDQNIDNFFGIKLIRQIEIQIVSYSETKFSLNSKVHITREQETTSS